MIQYNKEVTCVTITKIRERTHKNRVPKDATSKQTLTLDNNPTISETRGWLRNVPGPCDCVQAQATNLTDGDPNSMEEKHLYSFVPYCATLPCADFTHPDELISVPPKEITAALEINGMILNCMKRGFITQMVEAAQPARQPAQSGKFPNYSAINVI